MLFSSARSSIRLLFSLGMNCLLYTSPLVGINRVEVVEILVAADSVCLLYTSSIELCACRNVMIDHQQMQLFFTVFVMHGGDQHTTGVDTHHRSWRQIGDCNAGLTNQFFRLIIFVNSTQNDPIYAGSVVQNEL